MRILGIDPGTATTGCGVIESSNGKDFKVIKFCWISTDKKVAANDRLKSIHKQMGDLIKETSPDIVAIEKLFFFNNAKTAMGVSEAIGVLKLAATQKGLEVIDYAPARIKSIVAGNGRAKKDEMKKAVRKLLGVRSPNKKKTHFDDVADALGIAVCHAKLCLAKEVKTKK
ncbi:MAG: crossover junction endodeoxyribonuclease RuvC [Patescibacteria group bacterium]